MMLAAVAMGYVLGVLTLPIFAWVTITASSARRRYARGRVLELEKRNAAQQQIIANSHRNNEALRAELTRLQRARGMQ